MIITPKVSSDPAAAEAQNNSLPARRSSGPQAFASDAKLSIPNAPDIQTNIPGAVGSEAPDMDSEVADSHAADLLMNSLRSGITGQPGTAMLAQANLPSQSVYDLLR